jgi:hypothetical protein
MLPNLFGGPHLTVPFGLLAPLAVAVAVAWGFAAGDPRLEAVASRPLQLLDTAYALSVGMLTLVACAATSPLVGSSLALASGRNAVAYIGLMLLGRRLIGALAAPLLPVGLALVTAVIGHTPMGIPRWWAWLLFSPGRVSAWGMALALATAGALVSTVGQATMVAQHEEGD